MQVVPNELTHTAHEHRHRLKWIFKPFTTHTHTYIYTLLKNPVCTPGLVGLKVRATSTYLHYLMFVNQPLICQLLKSVTPMLCDDAQHLGPDEYDTVYFPRSQQCQPHRMIWLLAHECICKCPLVPHTVDNFQP